MEMTTNHCVRLNRTARLSPRMLWRCCVRRGQHRFGYGYVFRVVAATPMPWVSPSPPPPPPPPPPLQSQTQSLPLFHRHILYRVSCLTQAQPSLRHAHVASSICWPVTLITFDTATATMHFLVNHHLLISFSRIVTHRCIGPASSNQSPSSKKKALVLLKDPLH